MPDTRRRRERPAVSARAAFGRSLHRVGVLAVVLCAAGCAALAPQRPSAIYDLSAPGTISNVGRGTAQVLVPKPSAVSALDNNRIAARPSASEYAYLPGAVWSDALPQLLQARLVQALQNSGRVRAAGTPGQGLLIDVQLVVDVRAFELNGNGAVAEFGVRMMDDRNGRVLRTRVFREVVTLPATDTASVVAGLDQAMDQAFTNIIAWAFPRG